MQHAFRTRRMIDSSQIRTRKTMLVYWPAGHPCACARHCIGASERGPWIFHHARERLAGRTPTPPSIIEQGRTLRDHFRYASVIHGERVASRQMRKFGIKFAAIHPEAAAVKKAFIAAESLDDWSSVIDRF